MFSCDSVTFLKKEQNMSFHKKNIHPSYVAGYPDQLSQTYQPFRPMTVGLGRLDAYFSCKKVKMCCHNL